MHVSADPRDPSCPPSTVAALPDPPRFDLWPVAVRSALRLQGVLVPCGPGLRGIGWPDHPRVRLSALAEWLDSDRTATHMTAAWVWGAARSPGRPLRASARSGRAKLSAAARADPSVLLHELRLAEHDRTRFGSFSVTTPARTILDLLYDPARFERNEHIACRLLLASVEGGAAAIGEHLSAHRRPLRTLATKRFHRLTHREE